MGNLNKAVPNPPNDGNWLAWVNRYYPYSDSWNIRLKTRSDPPVSESIESLNDLRGIPIREWAAMLATLWFRGIEQKERIEREHRQERLEEQSKDRRRLIRLAQEAYAGRLGDTRESREAAQTTAQRFVGCDPENATWEVLTDWWAMHLYARATVQGRKCKRPMLHRDRIQQKKQREILNDADAAIGAERYEQGGLW